MTAGHRLPDFVIAGAMKSATTTIHHVLATHPAVYIPEGEYHLYSVDDPIEHSPWHRSIGGEWCTQDFDADPDHYMEHHAAAFAAAGDADLVGVDAPSYLTAERVPERIARHQPELKVIFILRDPALRTHSAYWHMVRWGIETRPFERALLEDPLLLRRSHYLTGLRRYFDVLPRENIFVMCFEDLVADPRDPVHDLLGFLGLDDDGVAVDIHGNPGQYPRWPQLLRMRNRILRSHWYPVAPAPSDRPPVESPSRWVTAVRRTHSRLNPSIAHPPPMRDEVHRWLDSHLRQANRGLSDLLGWDIESRWFHGPGAP